MVMTVCEWIVPPENHRENLNEKIINRSKQFKTIYYEDFEKQNDGFRFGRRFTYAL
jgi:hypothetical protein